MSAKNMDPHNRFRCKTISFRMSPEEADQLTRFAFLSGMTKQDYLIRRSLQQEIQVHGNPRIHKALRTNMKEILAELRRLSDGATVDPELLICLGTVSSMWAALNNEENSPKTENRKDFDYV